MQPGLLLEFNASLGGQKQQCPEHTYPVMIQIGGSDRCPVLDQSIEINPVQGIVPAIEKDAKRCCCFRKLFAVGQFSHLCDRFSVAVALAPLSPFRFQVIGLQLFGDGLKLVNQFTQGDGSFQRGRRNRPAFEMPLGAPWQIEARIKPGLIVIVSLEAFLHLFWGWKHAGFQHFGFQSDQNGGSQKGFAAIGKVLFIAAAPLTQDRGNLAGDFNSLTELIEKAVHYSDDVNVPGIQLTGLGSILQEANGQTGAGISPLG
jgi:hypothetical protein